MFDWCTELCRSKKDKEKAKKDKKDKHGKDTKEDAKGANKHKIRNVYHYSMVGIGKKNCDQDTLIMFEITDEAVPVRFFGVFDGHGDQGRDASLLANVEFETFIRANVKKILKFRDMRDYKERVKKMFKQMYLDAQKKFEKNKKAYIQSGTTAVCVLQIDNELFIMNVGDSRCVMCNVEGGEISAMEMSTDHKPFHPVEKERIEKAGGEILPKEGTSGPLRVWKRDEETPGLAVTRTLGDLLGHSIGVSSEPDIEYWKVMNDDYFLLIASDGIWDVMNSAEVVGFLIRETEDMKKGVVQLVQTARSIWEYQNLLRNQQRSKNVFNKANPFRSNQQQEKAGAIDDISAVLIVLNPKIDKSLLLNA